MIHKHSYTRKLFEVIGYAIPRAATKTAVDDLFEVLRGSKPLAIAAAILTKEKAL